MDHTFTASKGQVRAAVGSRQSAEYDDGSSGLSHSGSMGGEPNSPPCRHLAGEPGWPAGGWGGGLRLSSGTVLVFSCRHPSPSLPQLSSPPGGRHPHRAVFTSLRAQVCDLKCTYTCSCFKNGSLQGTDTQALPQLRIHAPILSNHSLAPQPPGTHRRSPNLSSPLTAGSVKGGQWSCTSLRRTALWET